MPVCLAFLLLIPILILALARTITISFAAFFADIALFCEWFREAIQTFTTGGATWVLVIEVAVRVKIVLIAILILVAI